MTFAIYILNIINIHLKSDYPCMFVGMVGWCLAKQCPVFRRNSVTLLVLTSIVIQSNVLG
jgi:uncharacterized membrane protein YjjB (DUF3815 family)